MRKLFWSSVLLVLCSWIAVPSVSGQTPPGPTTISTVSYANVAIPASVEIVQEVIDFAPGARTPNQTRGGDLFVTVAEGEILLRKGGSDVYYSAAARNPTFRVNKGETYSLGNPNGAVKARIYTSTVIAPGTALTATAAGEPASPLPPLVVMTSKAASPPLPGAVTVVQVVWDFEPGAATPPHTHHGFFLVTVVDGELARKTIAGEKFYKSGEAFTEASGIQEDAIVRNASAGRTRNFFTVLATQVPPSTTLPALPSSASGITPPNTGEAGLLGQGDALMPLAAAALIAFGAGTVVMRRTKSRPVE